MVELKYLIRLASFILFSLLLNNCGMGNGLVVGGIVDEVKPDYVKIDFEELETIKTGNFVILQLDNQTLKIGEYLGVSQTTVDGKVNLDSQKFISILTVFGQESIEMERVIKIELKASKNAALKGLLYGAAFDLFILWIGGY